MLFKMWTYNYFLFCHSFTSVIIRRNRVQMFAVQEWPGNEIPIFRGPGSDANRQKLDKPVSKLLPECQFSSPTLAAVFNKNAIRQHVLDSLNERRRVHVEMISIWYFFCV